MLAALAAVVVLATGVVTSLASGDPAPTESVLSRAEVDAEVDAEVVRRPTRVVPAVEPAPSRPTSFAVAHATGSSVALFDAPGAADPSGSRSNPTHEDRPLIMSVRERQGDWLRVALPQRPNGTEAWIRGTEVQVSQVPNHIVIELGARRLTLYHGDTVLMQEPVGVGTGRTPTPTGDFYIDVFNPLANTSGPYGWGQLSVAGFSDVLHSFAGGNGQIAIHGTNNPARVGSPVSNGCVRMTNEAIEALAAQAPAGTPVQVVA